MTIEEPRWWRYVIMEDVNGVGVVVGFREDTPQDVIDEYYQYQEWVKNRDPDIMY